ncbi:sugar kinase [Allonocardiopsis opalescens]|uniref:5-dehydro-2-deoxygluconokinase n=1 Tax=Allonocardiopsis opalescens TaxID=1144618 RepID=A0A2T0Q9N1_9ACTN|nr:sugar kinase [Allonocardiopsis opalescens]PRY00520.1 5-dehydro-2-deoxygluconokinase [Allonocardiopsis opalescens]
MAEGLDVATLGEGLVVFDPAHPGPLRHVAAFTKRVAGAEVNVAVALARLGHRTAWSGRVGADEFGAQVLGMLRAEGVDVSRAQTDPDAPTGIYFKEWSAPRRLAAAFYRTGAAGGRLAAGDLDHSLSARVLHLTGIPVALSDTAADTVRTLADAAVARGTLLSFDVNMRHRLLAGRDPQRLLGPLARQADLLFMSDAEAAVLTGGDDPEHVRRFLATARARTAVVHGEHGCYAVHDGGVTEQDAFPVPVADPVGAGDAFAAAFLSGLLRGEPVARCLRLASAAGACAVSVPGDAESMPWPDALARLADRADHVER